MSNLKPPPVNDPLVGADGKPPLNWRIFFDFLFSGDTGSAWTPVLVNLTITGASPVVSGRYYKVGQFCFFEVQIIPGTTTTSTAASTYISNFPLQMQADGFCLAVYSGTGTVAGHCFAGGNQIYTPAWSAVANPVTVFGIVRAK